MSKAGRKATTTSEANPSRHAAEARNRKPQRTVFLARDLEGREKIVTILKAPAPADLLEGDAITALEVRDWFRRSYPKWPEPTDDSLLNSFVDQLNEFRLSEPFRV